MTRIDAVTYLAAGEYNENWLVAGRSPAAAAAIFVCRVNHGTQLDLARQAEYEFAALQAVAASSVTPAPYFVSAAAPNGEGRGAIFMEYLPGTPLDYRNDLEGAARCLARIHQLPPSPALIDYRAPAHDLLAESGRLLIAGADHPHPPAGARLRRWRDELAATASTGASPPPRSFLWSTRR